MTIARPRCVFIGAGSWGQRLLSRVEAQFDVAAVVTQGSPRSGAWLAQRFPETPHLIFLDDALSLPDIDAAFLATPTPTHATLACRALGAGAHVFVEKPLALDAATATTAVRTASAQDLELFIGFVYLFHPGFDFLRVVFHSQAVSGLHFDWVRDRLTGPLHEELLCHDLAVTIAMTGELPDKIVVERTFVTLLQCRFQLPSGLACTSRIQLRNDVPKRRRVNVRCAEGDKYVWLDDRVYLAREPGRDLLDFDAQFEDPVSREVRAFRAAMEGSGPRMVDDERLSVGIGQLLDQVGQSIRR